MLVHCILPVAWSKINQARPNSSIMERLLTSMSSEILKDILPSQLINSDPRRYLEGSRLLFGLILEKAKQIKLEDMQEMPYLSSANVFDLRNTFTMEPIVVAVGTSV